MDFKEFKEKMENPRFKSMVYLGGYFVLGFILVMLARGRVNTYQPTIPQEPTIETPNVETTYHDKELLGKFNNYAYEITINHTINDTLIPYYIEGIRYKTEELFTYSVEENIYYVKDDQYYQVFDRRIEPLIEELFPINLIKLKPESLALMLNSLDATMENTIDGITTSTYYIPFETFIYYYDGVEMNNNKQPLLALKLEIAKDKNNIQEIEFDLTNFINQKEFTIEKLIYTCKFSNQNKIEKFNVDFIEQ